MPISVGQTVTLHPVETVLGDGFVSPGKHPDYPNVPPTDLADSVQVKVEWLSEQFALVRIASGHGAGAVGVVPSKNLS